jgi:hypothetical protein
MHALWINCRCFAGCHGQPEKTAKNQILENVKASAKNSSSGNPLIMKSRLAASIITGAPQA